MRAQRIKNALLDLIFPSLCVVCKKHLSSKSDASICETCTIQHTPFTTLFCATCHARLPENKKICHSSAPYLLGAPTHYSDEPVRALLYDLKYRNVRAAARGGASLLAQYINQLDYNFHNYIIIPVPLHVRRERKRGFNQSERIAHWLGKHINLQVLSNAARRTRATKPQVEITDAAERKKNVSGCFSVRRPETIQGNNILLIDDITTTGATLHELARAIKNAGAKKIVGLAVAKAR